MIDLAAIRNAVGVTQVQLAERLGVGQGQISRIEHQTDVLLSTLVDYLRALGVEAELTVKVRRRRITQTLTDTGEGS